MSPEDSANLLSFGIAILCLGFAVSMAIDEIKDYLIDRLHKKAKGRKINE